jgi:hypothetical protein
MNTTSSLSSLKLKMPFTVCCVVGSNADASEYEEVVAIHQFCSENGVDYSCREFDSARYEEDAIHIKTLPAFYIYDRKRVVQDTVYAESNPLRRIRQEILLYHAATEEAERRAAIRAARWSALKNIFRRSNKIATSK